mgnify:CR=1 FL=1
MNKATGLITGGEKLVGLDSRDFTLYDWRGFCKESSVRYLPTDLVGAMQIQLTLAGPEVLSWHGRGPNGMLMEGDYRGLHNNSSTDEKDAYNLRSGIKAGSYQINDIYWTVDTISVDQAYGDMLRGKIAQFGYISLLFKEYYTFFKSGMMSNNEQHRFSLAAGSIDKVYTVLRDANYNRQMQQSVNSIHDDGAHYTPMFKFVCPTIDHHHNYGVPFLPAASEGLNENGTTNTATALEAMTTANPPRPSWHFARDSDMTFNYKVNSVMHPQYECHERDAIWDCSYGQDNVNGPNGGNQIESRADWFENKAIFPLNLNLTDGPLQLMSGYDSRGHSSFLEFNVNGLEMDKYQYYTGTAKDMFPKGVTATTVVETTSELRIGAGLSLAVAR